jgi:hypothetical protein
MCLDLAVIFFSLKTISNRRGIWGVVFYSKTISNRIRVWGCFFGVIFRLFLLVF